MEARAALERGRSVIVVVPPAVEHAGVVWELLTPLTPGASPGDPEFGGRRFPQAVILCADAVAAVEWADVAPAGIRVHPVTGLTRTQRILQAGAPDVVAGAMKDLAALVARSALKLDNVTTIVIAWPESVTAPDEEILDTLLAEARDARRIVLTWDPSRILALLERHAHRAPMVGSPALDDSGRPAPPVGPARFAIVPRDRRASAARRAMDALGAVRPFLWRRGAEPPLEPVDAVLCLDLPGRSEFAALAQLAEPILLLSPSALPYARSLAAPLKPLSLPSPADLAQDRAEGLRADVSGVLEGGDVNAELAVLQPLFERYDPAEVAAALLSLSRQQGAVSHEPSAASRQPSATRSATAQAGTDSPRWTRIFVGVGKKDRASAKDLVGALIREAGLLKDEIGKVEVREGFSLVEVPEGAADKAVRGLTGATIRGRRVAVRRDRHG